MKKTTKKNHSNIWKTISLAYHCNHKAFYYRIILIFFSTGLLLVNILLFKYLIDSITQTINNTDAQFNSSVIWQYALIFGIVYLLSRITNVFIRVNNDFFSQKLSDYINILIQKKITKLDLSYFDDANFYDTFHRAQIEAGTRPLQVLTNFNELLGSIFFMIGIFAIFYSTSWLVIIIMTAAIIPAFIVRLTKSKTMYLWRKTRTVKQRESNYYNLLLSSRLAAKEQRAFGLSDYFMKKYFDIRKQLFNQMMKISRRIAIFDSLSAVVETTALLCVILFLINEAVIGAISLGSFVMLLEAFRRGQSYLQKIANSVAGLYDNKLFTNNLFEFLEFEPRIQTRQQTVPFPNNLTQGIVFNDVSFHYPNDEKMILSHFNFKAMPNQINNLEGENGFGKTTLVKLLYRFYDCTEGEILINGINIKQFDIVELRQHLSVIFQDFGMYNLSINENIAFGNINVPIDYSRIKKAAQLSTASDFIEKLPQQYETFLGKYFPEGEELSSGQWQRIALARAIYSDAPILILDEPTGWMDAKSTTTLLDNLNELKDKKLVILISHRV